MTAAMPHFFPDFFNDKDTPRSVEWLARMIERPAVKAALAMSRKQPGHRRPHNEDGRQTG